MLTVSEACKTTFPGAAVGALVMRDVTHPPSQAVPAQRQDEWECRLRERFAPGGRAAGVGEQAVRDHLRDIQSSVLLVAPEAVTGSLPVCVTSWQVHWGGECATPQK